MPRDWVRSVGRGGYAGLTTEQRLQLPPNLGEPAPEHRQVFDALMGGHPMGGPSGDKSTRPRCCGTRGWRTPRRSIWSGRPTSPKTVFVVIAGSGHVMYGQGINLRLRRRGAGNGITLVMTEADGPAAVARGIGDFVYVTTPGKEGPTKEGAESLGR